MSDEKKLLRAELVSLRRNMEKSVRKDFDERIYTNLTELDCVKRCGTFLVYASSPDEVDTRRFINSALSAGKTVAVPKCVGKEMRFLVIHSLSGLVKSRFGVDEPESGTEIRSFGDTVCIVPALRFDREGYRLGWGGGFYDRFLSHYTGVPVGVCYEQCCGEVSREQYDLPVKTVVTETGLYK